VIQWLKRSLLYAGELDGVATVTMNGGALRYHARGLRMWSLTLGEVGPRGRDGDSNRQRTTIQLGEVKGSSEGGGNEGANGKDRRESDHREAMRTSRDSREGGAFTKERTENLVSNLAHFYPDPLDTRKPG